MKFKIFVLFFNGDVEDIVFFVAEQAEQMNLGTKLILQKHVTTFFTKRKRQNFKFVNKIIHLQQSRFQH